MNFVERSKQVILAHQAASGAFVASPSFEHYQYSWLRDGTFIAYSLDLVQEQEAAARFHRWAADTIERHRDKVRQVLEWIEVGKEIPQSMQLHTRYTMEGKEVDGEWGTFQLDGYGTWLWGVNEHLNQWNDHQLARELVPTIQLVVDYLLPQWRMPNFDCWEENGEDIHLSTLAAIYGGLHASCGRLEEDRRHQVELTLQEMKNYLFLYGMVNQRFKKSINNADIDASLLWLHLPFHVMESSDSVMEETVRVIEEQLLNEGGLHRYPEDRYYGGGQWVLLVAWLGWHYAGRGDYQQAQRMLSWVRMQFDQDGFLPEQVSSHLLHPDDYQGWVRQWGLPACPLLWSHAMHLILEYQCKRIG